MVHLKISKIDDATGKKPKNMLIFLVLFPVQNGLYKQAGWMVMDRMRWVDREIERNG
jgi:hypothetical protein